VFSFKRSLIALVGLLVLVGTPLVGRGQGNKNPFNRDPRRSFYVTQTTHTGSQALTACAEGYHMASLWEIFDTSNLRYQTQLGVTSGDSGFGPPSFQFGWIRTGAGIGPPGGGSAPGIANCVAWTSASNADSGTVVRLAPNWEATATMVSPWQTGTPSCLIPQNVWCMQD
jgi:hypothetical protein